MLRLSRNAAYAFGELHQADGVGREVNWLCMRKRLITPTPETVRSRAEGRLDVERAAIVEITSEEKDFSVESVFVSGETRGWRAAEPGLKRFDSCLTSRKR